MEDVEEAQGLQGQASTAELTERIMSPLRWIQTCAAAASNLLSAGHAFLNPCGQEFASWCVFTRWHTDTITQYVAPPVAVPSSLCYISQPCRCAKQHSIRTDTLPVAFHDQGTLLAVARAAGAVDVYGLANVHMPRACDLLDSSLATDSGTSGLSQLVLPRLRPPCFPTVRSLAHSTSSKRLSTCSS